MCVRLVAAACLLAVPPALVVAQEPADEASEVAEGAGEREQAPPATRIALIDMAYVFQNYGKFETLRADLRTDVADLDVKSRAMATRLQTLQNDLKKHAQGSDQYIAVENDLARQKADYESFRRTAQRDMLKRESQVYRTIYLEVQDVVQEYAKERGFTLVLRFSREDLGEADDAKEILQNLNRSVIFHQPEDDITDVVLERLNKSYKSESR